MSTRPLLSPLLERLGVPHGFTRRDLDLPGQGAISWNVGREVALANRAVWWSRLNLPLSRTVLPRQIHGDGIAIVRSSDAGRGAETPETAIPDTDALVSVEPGIPIAVQCADCVPILLYAPDVPAVAAIHAGWRGTVRQITAGVVQLVVTQLGQAPERLWAVLGPSIGPCCYEVGEEVAAAWSAALGCDRTDAILWRDGRLYFDLWTANRILLERSGVLADHIEVMGVCTRCHAQEWFSYRATGPRGGAQAAVIALPRNEATIGHGGC